MKKNKEKLTIEDYKEVIESHKENVKKLDSILSNGSPAKQASLCDLLPFVKQKMEELEFLKYQNDLLMELISASYLLTTTK